MTNFEKITETPEALGELLASLTVIDSPWEDAFHTAFCADCERGGECDTEHCPHQNERNNPTWWMMQEAEVEQDTPPEELPEPLREIKVKIIESGCTPDQGINLLGSLRTVCIDNLKREKNPPRP